MIFGVCASLLEKSVQMVISCLLPHEIFKKNMCRDDTSSGTMRLINNLWLYGPFYSIFPLSGRKPEIIINCIHGRM